MNRDLALNTFQFAQFLSMYKGSRLLYNANSSY
jgi:hypothetical protein